jgi:hypothetical protein
MVLLQLLERLLLVLDRGLQLLDVFRPPFPEGGLGLPVTLLPFLGSGIDLMTGLVELDMGGRMGAGELTGLRPPLRLGACASGGGGEVGASGPRREDVRSLPGSVPAPAGEPGESMEGSCECSFLGMTGERSAWGISEGVQETPSPRPMTFSSRYGARI